MSAVLFHCKEEKGDLSNFSRGNVCSNEACAKSKLVGKGGREERSRV